MKRKQIKDNPKEYKALLEKENQIKQLLNIQCYDFLNSNVPMIREKEKKEQPKYKIYAIGSKNY